MQPEKLVSAQPAVRLTAAELLAGAAKMAPGAFTRTLEEWRAKGRMPAMLWQHDPGQPIGVWNTIREDATGLYVEGRPSETQPSQETRTLLKMGALSGLSIGFRTRKSTTDSKTGVRTLTDVELWKISVVTFPANDEARQRHQERRHAGPQ